jgi:multidrug resistance efflux pump
LRWAPRSGAVYELLLASGSVVRSGDALLTIIDARAHQKLSKLERERDRQQKRASTDRVFQFYLEEAERKLETLKRALTPTPCVAPTNGIVQYRVDVGAAVSSKSIVAEIADARQLRGDLPAASIPQGHSQCLARLSARSVKRECRLGAAKPDTLGQELIPIYVDNENEALRAGEWVEIEFAGQ